MTAAVVPAIPAKYRPSGPLSLDLIKPHFTKVAPVLEGSPVDTLDLYTLLKRHTRPLLRQYSLKQTGGLKGSVDLKNIAHGLPFRYLSHLTPDQLAKIWYSSVFSVSFDELFYGLSSSPHYDLPPEDQWDPSFRVLGKIVSSMWRWGYKDGAWNTVVDCYDRISSFDFAIPGFTVALDYTVGHNDVGNSSLTRTYLDGAFGYLVCYKGVHVMTLGWSLSGDGEILLSQVQLKQRKGNRWLFGIGKPLLDYVVDRFQAAFGDRFPLMLVDGPSLAQRIHKSYDEARYRAREEALKSGGPCQFVGPDERTMEHIAAVYSRDLTSFTRSGKPRSINGVKFHALQVLDVTPVPAGPLVSPQKHSRRSPSR